MDMNYYDSEVTTLNNGVVEINFKNASDICHTIQEVKYVWTNGKTGLFSLELIDGEIRIYPYDNIKYIRIYEA
jgi:hypothetical protein